MRNDSFSVKVYKCVFFYSVNTKVDLRFHVMTAQWIPYWIREKLREKVQLFLVYTLLNNNFQGHKDLDKCIFLCLKDIVYTCNTDGIFHNWDHVKCSEVVLSISSILTSRFFLIQAFPWLYSPTGNRMQLKFWVNKRLFLIQLA